MKKINSIVSALKRIVPEGDFCTQLTVPIDDLQIQLVGGEPVTLPLTQMKAKALIKQAKPAKFGWKEQTLRDKKVRDTWEIPRSKIKIDQRRWNKTLRPLLQQIKQNLGMGGAAKLKAKLHNILIYEPSPNVS